MKTLLNKGGIKKLFYFICFFILCICDQRIGSASGEIQLVCPNVVLIVLSCIFLSHYPVSSFCRRSFWIPAAVCAVGASLALYLMWPNAYYRYQLVSGAIAAVLYCCVLLQAAFAIYSKKRIPQGNHFGVILLFLLAVLILVSEHDRYSGFFLCLSVVLAYLTDFTALECKWLLGALGSAVLTAFFVFQGMAFVFRPYDTLRYLGLYANTNINALFYQMVFCVFLGGFCTLELKKKHCFWKWVCFCFACSMWSFVLLTMCRSAILGMTAATVLGFGIILWKRHEARLRRSLLYICGMILGGILSFPVVYGAVRYLPPVFHHPIWFMEEYSEEKVHSWDPYDSEKYTDWRDVLQENFGRLFQNSALGNVSEQPPEAAAPSGQHGLSFAVAEESPILLASAELCPLPVGIVSSAGIAADDGQSAKKERLTGDSISARVNIYRYYISNLNMRGHKDSENGIWLSEHHFASHAHDVILQYAFNYGLPAGIILLVYLAASGIRFLLVAIRKDTDLSVLPGLLLFAAIVVFGITEVVWRYGQLSHTLMLLLPRFAWQYQADTAGCDEPVSTEHA